MVLSRKQLLFDSFNRVHNYLRISLTERCNLRCKYCMPQEGITLTQDQELLSFGELTRLTKLLVEQCGIDKVRLTGGEPTVYKNLMPLLSYFSELRGQKSGLKTIAMTTNGLMLKKYAKQLKSSGVNVLNISLDTLNADKFELMTRRKGWQRVMNGIEAALEEGFDQVKLNCVVMRGYNDSEVIDFCKFALNHPIDIRFIEFMPFYGNKWSTELLVPQAELLRRVNREFPTIVRLPPATLHDTSRIYKTSQMRGSIGFISSMTDNFCSGCNRLRLTADGQLKVCLFDQRELSLRDLIRSGHASDDELINAIRAAIWQKKKQHGGLGALERDVYRPMIKIGGRAKMVNVIDKMPIKRVAVAEGEIKVGCEVITSIKSHSMSKGDILTVSKVAAIMGAKKTGDLIPMCHQISLDHIDVEIFEKGEDTLVVRARTEALHRTGVEMESLMSVSIGLLTLYDMCKSVNKTMTISNIRLIEKRKEMANNS